jgi:hypothetical protein
MPQEPTKNKQRTMTGYAQSNHKADASSVQRWEPGLKPSRMTGYSLSVGHRHTRAMLPTPLRRVSPKLDVPTWHRAYGESLLETNPEILAKSLAATEVAIFKRLLELAFRGDVSDERLDIARAIEVVLSLKTGKSQLNSTIPPTNRLSP